MNIAILGGTGFIGKALASHLHNQGHQLLIWSRFPKKTPYPSSIQVQQWPIPSTSKKGQTLPIDAVINLAGETINQRWTPQAKQRIIASRVAATRQLIQLVEEGYMAPKVWINASGIGYYGTSEQTVFTEESEEQGEDFLAQVTATWEAEANRVQELGIRLIKARIGLVLGKDGGALSSILLPIRLFVGGQVGSGKQWISWVHLQDLAAMFSFALEHPIEGVMNITAPNPVQMQVLGKQLATIIRRPYWFPTPALILKIALGEMSDLVLKGQQVLPHKALQHGYRFRYEQLEEALQDILQA